MSLISLHPANVLAEERPESANGTSEYDRLTAQAVAAYDARDYQVARTRFKQANDLEPSARALRAVAMCSYNLRDPIDAILQLEAALDEPRKALSEEQRASSLELLRKANAKVASFPLRLAPETTMLTVDGESARITSHSVLLLLPGTHQVRALAPAYAQQERTVDAVVGMHEELHFDLQPALSLASAPAGPSLATHDDNPPTGRTLRLIGVGVGALGMVVFTVTGALALRDRASLRDSCYEGNCGPSLYAQVDSYNRLKIATTAGLVTGSVLLASDFVWWLHDRRKRRQTRRLAALSDSEPRP